MFANDARLSSPAGRLLVVSGLSAPSRDLVAEQLAEVGWLVADKTDREAKCQAALSKGKDVVVSLETDGENTCSAYWQGMSRAFNAKSIALHLQGPHDPSQPRQLRQNLEINGAAGYDQVFQASRNSDLEALYELLGQQGQRSSRAPVENKAYSNGKGQPQRRRSYEATTPQAQRQIPYDGNASNGRLNNHNFNHHDRWQSNNANVLKACTDQVSPTVAHTARKKGEPRGQLREASPKLILDNCIQPKVAFDLQLDNKKPIILFDLNGTLTSHTHQRHSAGENLMRPGTAQLRRLLGSFNLGIYTSASPRTVAQVRAMLEAAAGPGLPLFTQPNLILYRMHTIAATAEHLAGGGKEWDTRKPLRRYFSRLWRVLLVDDDAFKACEGEERNMVLMPRWEGEANDTCIEQLVNALLAATDGMEMSTDLRQYSKAISGCICKPAGIA